MSLSIRQSCVLLFCCTLTVTANLNTGGERGVVRTLSAKTLGKSKMKVGGGINYAQSSGFLEWLSNPKPDKFSTVLDANNSESVKLLSSNLFLALGLTSFWDLAVSLPLYFDGSEGGLNDFGMGDVCVKTKLLYPKPDKKRVFYQAYDIGLAVGVPQMYDKGIYPRHAYYYYNNHYTSGNDSLAADIFASNLFTAIANLVWTFDIGSAAKNFPLQIHVNLGGDFPVSQGSLPRREICANANLAFEISPVEIVSIFLDFASEIRGETIIEDITNIRRDPIWFSPGIRINAPSGVYVYLAADIGLSKTDPETAWRRGSYQYKTAAVPLLGAQFAFGWEGFLAAQDDDRDGIKNNVDRCPKDKEDIDGFEDADGCPDEDNDGDGIPDTLDKCPLKAEDKDGFEDEDGCPDGDNDGDGIPDIKDQCPKLAEDFDGFEDKDGCPDEDNDKDGVADSLDKCPNDVEDFDQYEDEDGCPDIDNDKDGIPDLKDKCPNKPETFNDVDDKDGCPDEKKQESSLPKHQILKGVDFRSGRSEMTFNSYRYIDPVVEEMKKYPEIEIEIRGHTDSVGKYESNMRLSKMRAESVRQYMINQGIQASRVRAVGFGSSSPIADNRTAAGRAQNRRVEIVRIK